MQLTINGKTADLDLENDMPLLWALRDELNIKGPKFGCGKALCGACTVLVDGEPVRSCSMPVGDVAGEITTIEGLADGEKLHAVQQAWLDEQVPQCGYCQAGQIMSTVALLKENPSPDDAAINSALEGNLCRCGASDRIRRAVHRAAKTLAES